MDIDITTEDIKSLSVNTVESAKNLINETDDKKIKNLTYLFNLNQAKRNVIRVMKLNDLLDKVWDEAYNRVTNNPNEFSNVDLLNYSTAIQTAIERANKSLALVDEAPLLQLNQVNVQVDGKIIDRESRTRIENAIEAITSKLNNKIDAYTEESDAPLLTDSEDNE